MQIVITMADILYDDWLKRFENLHPMVFDGCESSKENFQHMLEDFKDRPNEAKRQLIEGILKTFELASSGWEIQNSEVSS